MGLFDFINKRKDKNSNQSDNTFQDEPQRQFIEDMTNNAQRIVEADNPMLEGALDYSVNSLDGLDDLLSQFYINRNDVDNEMKKDLIPQAGAYIFEVARRNYGGKYYWHNSTDQPILVTGQPDFEVSILAFEKVKNRIENGKEDHIPFYFKGYIERVERKQSGLIV